MDSAIGLIYKLPALAFLAGTLAFGQTTTTQPATAPPATSPPAAAPPAASPPEAPAQTAPAPDAKPISRAEPAGHVTVISPGNEPRTLLRYAPAAGDKQRLMLTINTQSDAKLGGGPFPGTPIPGMRIAVQTEVQAVTPEGDIHLTFKLADGEVVPVEGAPDHLIQRMERTLNALSNAGGSVVLDNRGLVKQGALDLPAFANPNTAVAVKNIRTALEQLIVPLPLEPIGAGGSWSATHVSDSNPNRMILRQTAVYEIAATPQSDLALKVHVTQDADRQMLGSSPQAGNSSMELVSHQGNGGGDVAVKLSHILPTTSKLRVDSNSKLEFTLAGETQILELKFTLDVQAESRAR